MQAVGTCSPQKDEVGTPTRTPSGAIRYLINYLGESPKSPTSPKPRLRDQKPLPPVIGQAKKRALHVAYAAAHFTTLGSTLGLRWRDVGVEKPVTGTEIQNTALATALEGDKWKFTKQELNNFKIDMSDLTSSTFIKAGNKYWAAGRAPRLGSEGTSEEIEAENRELRNEIEKLERKLDNYQEMLKHSRASYDAAVHTLMRTITQDETVAVALLVQKYEEERSQSTKELELIKKEKERIQKDLDESQAAETTELQALKERELELQEELQTLKKKNEQEIADEKQKNEHLPRAGNRVSELKDMLHQRVEEIAALKKQNQEMKGLSSTQRWQMNSAVIKQQEAEKKAREAQDAVIVKQKEAEALEAKAKQLEVDKARAIEGLEKQHGQKLEEHQKTLEKHVSEHAAIKNKMVQRLNDATLQAILPEEEKKAFCDKRKEVQATNELYLLPSEIDGRRGYRDQAIEEEMRREMFQCTDPAICKIKSANYLIETDLKTEWEFVVFPDENAGTSRTSRPEYPGQAVNGKYAKNGKEGRIPVSLEEFLKVGKKEGLTRPEVIGLRIYSGPAYGAINGALRHRLYQRGKQNCPEAPHGCARKDYGACRKASCPVCINAFLEWEQVAFGSPPTGIEIHNKKLAAALQKKAVFNELEFTEFHVDIPSFEVTKIFDIYIRVPALGLRWEELKSRSPQPQNEIKHDKFATALQLKREFDDDELDVYQLKVSELTDDSYIMVGDKKFIPSCKYWTPAKGGTQQYFRCPNKTTPCPQCAPGRDSFSTIVAVINSGIKKLTRNDVTPLAQSRLLYRGLNGMALQSQLLDLDCRIDGADHNEELLQKNKLRSFVEIGFSSATPDKKVALFYAGGCDQSCKHRRTQEDVCVCEIHRSTLLEIETGQVDRGASLKWVSQFASEQEHTLLPLSNFEIIGMRRDGLVNIVQVKLNSNLEAKTLDELKHTRQTICLEFAHELRKEAMQLLLWERSHTRSSLALMRTRQADSNIMSMDQLETTLANFIHEIGHPAIPQVKCTKCSPGSIDSQVCELAIYFNDPHIFDGQMRKTFSSWRKIMLEAAKRLQTHAKELLQLRSNVSLPREEGMATPGDAWCIYVSFLECPEIKQVKVPCKPHDIVQHLIIKAKERARMMVPSTLNTMHIDAADALVLNSQWEASKAVRTGLLVELSGAVLFEGDEVSEVLANGVHVKAISLIHTAARDSARQARITLERILSDVSTDTISDSARSLLNSHYDLVQKLIASRILRSDNPEDLSDWIFFSKHAKASGLKWRNVGDSKPSFGSGLVNQTLAEALTSKTDFTENEWSEFGINDLHSDDFIESHGFYFKIAEAAEAEIMGKHKEDMKTLASLIAREEVDPAEIIAQEGVIDQEGIHLAETPDSLSILRDYVRKARTSSNGIQHLNLIGKQLLMGAQLSETASIYCCRQNQLVDAAMLLEEALVNKVMILGSDDGSVDESLCHFRALISQCTESESEDDRQLAKDLPCRVFHILRSPHPPPARWRRDAPDNTFETIPDVIASMILGLNLPEWGCSALHSLIEANSFEVDDQSERQSVFKAVLDTSEKHSGQRAGVVRESLIVIIHLIKVEEKYYEQQELKNRKRASEIAIRALDFYTGRLNVDIQKLCLEALSLTHEQVTKGTVISNILSSLDGIDLDPKRACVALDLLLKLCSSEGAMKVWATETVAMHDGEAIISKVIGRHPEVEDCGRKCLRTCQESINKIQQERKKEADLALARYEMMKSMTKFSQRLDVALSSCDRKKKLSFLQRPDAALSSSEISECKKKQEKAIDEERSDLVELNKERENIRDQYKKLLDQHKTLILDEEAKDSQARLDKLECFLATRYLNTSSAILDHALKLYKSSALTKEFAERSLKMAEEDEVKGSGIASELNRPFREENKKEAERKRMFSTLRRAILKLQNQRSIASAAPNTQKEDRTEAARWRLLEAKSYLFLNWKSSFVRPTAVTEITQSEYTELAKALSDIKEDEPELELSLMKKAISNTLSRGKNIPLQGYIQVGAQFFQPFVTAKNLECAKAKHEEAAEMAPTVPDLGLVKDLIDKAEETMNLYTCKHALETARQLLKDADFHKADFQEAYDAYEHAEIEFAELKDQKLLNFMLSELDRDIVAKQLACLEEGNKEVTTAFECLKPLDELNLGKVGAAVDYMERAAQITEKVFEYPPKASDVCEKLNELKKRLYRLQDDINVENQNTGIMERGDSNLKLARESLEKGNFKAAQEKFTRAADHFKKISNTAPSSEILRQKVQMKLKEFKQHCIKEGQDKVQEVRNNLTSYQASDWQKGLLIKSKPLLNDAREYFKIGRDAGDDQTGNTKREQELQDLEKKITKAQEESNFHTPR